MVYRTFLGYAYNYIHPRHQETKQLNSTVHDPQGVLSGATTPRNSSVCPSLCLMVATGALFHHSLQNGLIFERAPGASVHITSKKIYKIDQVFFATFELKPVLLFAIFFIWNLWSNHFIEFQMHLVIVRHMLTLWTVGISKTQNNSNI